MAKPDISLSRFASGPGDDTTAPSSGLRDTGFVAGTPIVQSYVNELFFRHYEYLAWLDEPILLPVSAGAFHLISGSATYDSSDQFWHGVGELQAQLVIPCESKLINIDWGANRGGSGSITLAGRTLDLADGTSLIGTLDSIGSGTGYVVRTLDETDLDAATDTPNVITATRFWNLHVSMTDAANKLYGAIATYRRT